MLAAAAPALAGGSQEPHVVGHRGAAGLAPENTLAGFARALELGADGIEMDVHLTHDGVAVVHHDPRLRPETTRGADGRWLHAPGAPLRTLRLEQLKVFDVGRLKPDTAYARRFPEQVPADGARIPTLREVLDLVRRAGTPRTRLWIEIKTSPLTPALTAAPGAIADAVIVLARQAGVAHRTVLLSFDWRALVHAQKVAPEIATDYLTAQFEKFDTLRAGQPGASPWLAGFDVDDFGGSAPRAIHAAGGRYWGPHHGAVTRQTLDEAHALGLRVVPWTVNEAADMRRLMALGVDGITTDRPDRLLEILGRR
jgi:glycerophosphoryl diester phosphodiesterase